MFGFSVKKEPETLDEINAEIARLNEKRQGMFDQKKADLEEYIKSLEWTKDCEARLDICYLEAAGLPTYKILVFGQDTPKHSSLTIMGESSCYQNNIIYAHYYGDNVPCFYTDSEDILIEFLKKVKFKKLEYSEKHLKVLKAARDYGRSNDHIRRCM